MPPRASQSFFRPHYLQAPATQASSLVTLGFSRNGLILLLKDLQIKQFYKAQVSGTTLTKCRR